MATAPLTDHEKLVRRLIRLWLDASSCECRTPVCGHLERVAESWRWLLHWDCPDFLYDVVDTSDFRCSATCVVVSTDGAVPENTLAEGGWAEGTPGGTPDPVAVRPTQDDTPADGPYSTSWPAPYVLP